MQMPDAGSDLNAKCKHYPPPRRAHYLQVQSPSTPLFLLNSTPRQALLDALRYTYRDRRAEGVNIGAIHHLAKRRLDDIRAEANQLIEDLAGAEILVVEGGHEGRGRAVGVELRVHAALVEGRHLVGLDLVGDDPALAGGGVEHAVLGQHLGHEAALGDDLELDGARVHVGRVEGAAVEEADGHAGAGAHKGGEGLAVGGDQVALAAAFAFELGVGEVEDEGGVVGEEGEAVHGCVGEEELLG